ncbi:MAG TPA: ParB/RepB/Spo0J family partition protein [Ignavibacteria bacterium]|nr:ParB/RepB/Spo0J family partition protein [Ignavibacteria bacterium]
MDNKKHSLGKGLSAIFGEKNVDINSIREELPPEGGAFIELDIKNIIFNKSQPRENFDEEKLNELADSIKLNGILQPVTVRQSDTAEMYELIAGERRVRAAMRAGLRTVPAYIYKAQPDSMMELALIENIQRENLNPIELSNSYQRLIDEYGLTQEQIADKVSRQRSTVANFLRLQKLPDEIKQSLIIGDITEAHARMILRVDNEKAQFGIWKKIIAENLTVRELDDLTKKFAKRKKSSRTKKEQPPGNTDIENQLMTFFGTKVKIVDKGNSKGEIIIEYYSEDDLERILEICTKINF